VLLASAGTGTEGGGTRLPGWTVLPRITVLLGPAVALLLDGAGGAGEGCEAGGRPPRLEPKEPNDDEADAPVAVLPIELAGGCGK
jgi:hypothetical protein